MGSLLDPIHVWTASCFAHLAKDLIESAASRIASEVIGIA